LAFEVRLVPILPGTVETLQERGSTNARQSSGSFRLRLEPKTERNVTLVAEPPKLREPHMINAKIAGLDKLQRELEDAQRAFQSLNGTVATLEWNPADPTSVQEAIRTMEAAVDRNTAPYRGNDLVVRVADGLKETYRRRILEQRSAAGE
jgi:hypothetical protein